MGEMADFIEEHFLFQEKDEEVPNYKEAKRKPMYKKNTAPLEKELIVVELSGNGQYGPYIKANGEFYGMNDPLTDADFQKGEAYNILFKRGKPSDKSPGGKKYIAQIVGDSAAGSVSSPPAPSATAPVAKAAAPAAEKAKADYASNESAKNKRILWQGVVQAVAQSPIYAGGDVETFINSVEKTSEALVAFILEKAGA